MQTPVITPRRRLYAVLGWFGTFVGFSVAFDVAVFAIDLGPFDIAAVVVICLMVALGIANAIAFWRYSNALGGRPTLALFVLLIAIAWAVVGAGLIHLLFQAFDSTR